MRHGHFLFPQLTLPEISTKQLVSRLDIAYEKPTVRIGDARSDPIRAIGVQGSNEYLSPD
jgi:hypothetical protein